MPLIRSNMNYYVVMLMFRNWARDKGIMGAMGVLGTKVAMGAKGAMRVMGARRGMEIMGVLEGI